MRDPALPKKPRRSLPFGQEWNQAAWKDAVRRAKASKEPFCGECHQFVDVTLPMKDEDGKRNPLACEVDHIVPSSRGGQLYDLSNLRLTHMRCNRKKGAKMHSDYEGLDGVSNPVPLSNNW